MSRLNLHEALCAILDSKNVYFQPPATVQMKYPAIRYARKDIESRFANNCVYIQAHSYEVTLIDKNPDSKYVEALSQLTYATFDRHYIADNLNHWTFTVYDN